MHLAFPLPVPLLLAGCTATLSTGIALSDDRRTDGTTLDDARIAPNSLSEVACDRQLIDRTQQDTVRDTGIVLLAGKVESPLFPQRIRTIAERENRVGEVKKELRIGTLSNADSQNHDTVLTSHVKSRRVSDAGIDGKVIIEQGTIDRVGRVTPIKAQAAASVTHLSEGLLRIVRIFEYRTQAVPV